jgi:hypothetical protein
MKKHILFILFSFFCVLSIYGQKLNNSKYSVKVSTSIFKDFLQVIPWVDLDDEPNLIRKNQLNVNLHFCVKPTLISEFGINLGFLKYSALDVVNEPFITYKNNYAPIVGFNYNLHIFPLLKIQTKKIDLYFISNYGFTYLSKIGEQNLWEVLMYENENESKIRHFYGLGLGGSVLLSKSFGFFIETLFGNYSLRSELVSSYSNTKIGIQYSW